MHEDLLFVFDYCTNLKHIEISCNYKFFKWRFPEIAKLKTIESVKIDQVKTTLKFVVETLKELPNLKSLHIICDQYWEGNYISELKTIENLVLYYCKNTKYKYFKSICAEMTQLRQLYLFEECSGDYEMDTRMYKAMVEDCKNLEHLWFFSIGGRYELVADLPKLKWLSIYYRDTKWHPELFVQLAAKKSHQLEALKLFCSPITKQDASYIGQIDGLRELVCRFTDIECFEQIINLKRLEYVHYTCDRLTDENALQIIENNPNLVYIHIGSKLLTINFLLNAIKLLRAARATNSRKNCKLLVGVTKQFWQSRERPEFENSRHILELVCNASQREFTLTQGLKYENMNLHIF